MLSSCSSHDVSHSGAARSLEVVGLLQEEHRLRGETGGEQGDQARGDGEQPMRRHREQAKVDQRGQRRAEQDAAGTAGHHVANRRAASGEDAVEEKHDLGTFAQHRDANDDGEGGQRPIARRNGTAHGAHLARHLAAMARHPGVVPGQHADGGVSRMRR